LRLSSIAGSMLRRKIVIIDDEEDLCHLMKTYLTDLDYDVHLAHTLHTGLALLTEVIPDILFIDNNLPDGLGWEKMAYIKEHFPACKINLISAYHYVPLEAEGDNNAVKIIEKPLRLNLLKDYL
jgi:two-component system OmpR family response regulator